jgi:hypothetical protein
MLDMTQVFQASGTTREQLTSGTMQDLALSATKDMTLVKVMTQDTNRVMMPVLVVKDMMLGLPTEVMTQGISRAMTLDIRAQTQPGTLLRVVTL